MPRLLNRLTAWWLRREVGVWYHPAYRLPLSGAEGQIGLEPRRADFVAWYLVDRQVVRPTDVREPKPVSYEDLCRVHDAAWLEQLAQGETLARIFAASPEEVKPEELMHMARLACGGTLEAARWALAHRAAALNLNGGFHHAGRASGGGFCPVNDLAVAVATLRHEGFSGQVNVIDLDAHPPDGTTDCLAADERAWIGSISGADWGPLPRADETVLAKGAGDGPYLETLEALLARMPKPQLALVIAGGDVLAGDRLGQLGLSLAGVRRRDLLVARALRGVPSVWVPGGGYSRDAWRVLAGTGLALALDTERAISRTYDPLARRFAAIASGLGAQELGGDIDLSSDDVLGMLGLGARRPARLLDFYSAEGIELVLQRYGLLEQVRRLGYASFQVEVDRVDTGDRVRVFGDADGRRHLVIEDVLERRRIGELEVLYIHWLTLRHERAHFTDRRPQLPGQDVPGLGLARELNELHLRMARRLGLQGVAFRPSWYHMAYTARRQFRFVDPKRQGRFLAMLRDLGALPLLHVTLACSRGEVRMNGEPYRWEADEMIYRLDDSVQDDPATGEEASRVKFTLDEPAAA